VQLIACSYRELLTGWNQAESGLLVDHARAVAEMGGARCLTEVSPVCWDFTAFSPRARAMTKGRASAGPRVAIEDSALVPGRAAPRRADVPSFRKCIQRQSRNVTTYQNAKRKKKQRAGVPSLPVVPVFFPGCSSDPSLDPIPSLGAFLKSLSESTTNPTY